MTSLSIHPFRAALSLLFFAITVAVGQAADETVGKPLTPSRRNSASFTTPDSIT